eukprot:1138167-Pelagomonas_calceolata.AAC.4
MIPLEPRCLASVKNTQDLIPSIMSPDGGEGTAEKFQTATLSWIQGSWMLSASLHVMTLLGDLYKEYDELAAELDLYTLDTIGDCEFPGGRGNTAAKQCFFL